MQQLSLSLVLPCFNEEGNIERTVRECCGWMDAQGIEGEIIAVNDGSSDRTGRILDGLREACPRLSVLHHARNRGYGAAIRSGCDRARQEYIAFMDSDGQFRAEDLSSLLSHLDSCSFVTGRRRRRSDSFLRNVFGKVLGLLNWCVFGLWVRDVNCGMKVFHHSLWPMIRPVHGFEKLFSTELFLRLQENGVAWCQIDVPHYPRLAGSPSGARPYVVVRMFRELYALRRSRRTFGSARGPLMNRPGGSSS